MKWLILIALFSCPVFADCSPSPVSLALIEQFEGYIPFVYKDVGGKTTIGFGHLILSNETFQAPLLPEDAQKLLERDLLKTMGQMNSYIHVSLNDNQCSSLGSLSFNIGNLKKSAPTLLQFVNQSRHIDAAKQILVYCKVRIDGELTIVKGLLKRRMAESNLYIKKSNE